MIDARVARDKVRTLISELCACQRGYPYSLLPEASEASQSGLGAC
jgi:hypothetical protein